MMPSPSLVRVGTWMLVAAAFLAAASAKICWEECACECIWRTLLLLLLLFSITSLLTFFPAASGRVFSADVDGCRRRPGRNGRAPRFRCEGVRGPPCFLRRGDKAILRLRFETDLGLSEVTHEAFWVMGTGFMLPWAGMDTDGCKFTDRPCGDKGGTRRNVTLTYPMDVLDVYPSVNKKKKLCCENKDGN